MGGYDDEVTALSERIAPLIPKMRLPYPRWISTPDGDEGREWCSDCGYYKVRNLRHRDRKNANGYILDGGWRTEEEHFCFCASCGVRLDVALTDHGVEEGINTYTECGFSTDRGEDAYEIGELLNAVDYRYDNETDDQAERRRAIIAIAERFLAVPA